MKQLNMAVILAVLVTLPGNTFTAEIKPIHKHCKTCKCSKQIKKPSWLIVNQKTVIACVICAGLIAGAVYVLRGKKTLLCKESTKVQPKVATSTASGAWNYIAGSRAAQWAASWFTSNTVQS